MLMRSVFIAGLFVVATLSTGAAVWQSLETNLREEQLSDASQALVAARTEARTFKEKAQLADRRIRVLEAATSAAASNTVTSAEDAKLRAELAAAKQQLAAAETAIRETEDRLSEEILAHAELKAKAQELKDEVAAASRPNAASDVNAASTAGSLSGAKPAASATAETPTSGATGSLPDTPSAAASGAPPIADEQAAADKRGAGRKVQARRPAKPVVRAVKPLGTPFEPML